MVLQKLFNNTLILVCGEIDALKACLNAGADISLADVNGASPLHFASQLCGANYEGKSDKASAKLALEVIYFIEIYIFYCII